MKRLVTAFFLLVVCALSTPAMAQQGHSAALRPGGASVYTSPAPFINLSKNINLGGRRTIGLPSIGQKPLSGNADSMSYFDADSTHQYKYYFYPNYINFSDGNGNITPDTMTVFGERFSSKFTSTYVDSVYLFFYLNQVSDNTDHMDVIVRSPATGTTPSIVSARGIDTVQVPTAALTLQDFNSIVLRFPNNYRKVSKDFFITMDVVDPDNIIAVLGDSISTATAPKFDVKVNRGYEMDISHKISIPMVGITYPDADGNQGEYTQTNFYMVAFVSDAPGSGVKQLNPTEFALAQNYPNPFNPSTEITYNLATGGKATLKVYNALGMEVATLVDGMQSAGNHTVKFDAASLPSGTYFYTLKSGDFSSTRRMVLNK